MFFVLQPECFAFFLPSLLSDWFSVTKITRTKTCRVKSLQNTLFTWPFTVQNRNFIHGNTYKKAVFHWTFSLNSTLGLFTSLQCIQNTLLVAASSQTQTSMADFGPSPRREGTERGCALNQKPPLTSDAFLQSICVYLRSAGQAGRGGEKKDCWKTISCHRR